MKEPPRITPGQLARELGIQERDVGAIAVQLGVGVWLPSRGRRHLWLDEEAAEQIRAVVRDTQRGAPTRAVDQGQEEGQ
jgi:hypothetical protein